ncbi:hypothetical protein P2G88_13415 [Aliiglaciecola sp. CAU 1673]|uniref:hypothetical protein n=1 Tax=Aliiglaciecola sp. CAU 1673 TaxID=3032595 RepID=UPI0023DA657A|nr:hypothetical protein [Aliiglaciecola sp. CAU 1673]MDF2179253.1 hypothetical protein [Aliiglaciecola sp. CAU 1673]
MSAIANKRTLIVLLVVFVVPVLLAKLALEMEWFNRGATNKGQLLDPALSLASLGLPTPPKWRLLYVVPVNCGSDCENALFSIHQVWQALGKEQDRAEAVAVVTAESDTTIQSKLAQLPHVHIQKSDTQNVNEVFKDAGANGIFLSDTLGNVILRYPLEQEQQNAVLGSRDILADLRKLLKLSRIG